MSHPVSDAIVKRDLELLRKLIIRYEKDLGNIKAKFSNTKEPKRLPFWEMPYFKWQFIPEEGDREGKPLETACRIGWLAGVTLLLDHGLSARHCQRLAYVDPLVHCCGLVRKAMLKSLNSFWNGKLMWNVLMRLSALRVLIDNGVNINQPVNTGYFRENPPVTIVCFEEGFTLLKLMVAVGADVESYDWRGKISWTFGYNSENFIKDLLILRAQVGNKVNARTFICCMQDMHDHRGGCGTPVRVPGYLQLYQEGKLYREHHG